MAPNTSESVGEVLLHTGSVGKRFELWMVLERSPSIEVVHQSPFDIELSYGIK